MLPNIRTVSQKSVLRAFLYLITSSHYLYSQSPEISLPLNRAVYQRNINSQAIVPIAVQFKNGESAKFSYKIEKIDTKTGLNPAPITISTLNIPTDGLFQTTVQLNAGWYQLVVQTYRQDESMHENSSVRFGIGEVIYSAGQSNLQGVELGSTGSPQLPGEPYDGLSVVNQNCFCKKTFPFPVFEKMERGAYDTQKKIAPNGNQNLWCYEVMGRKLSDTNGQIPVAFFNAASTATTISNWLDSAENPNAVTHNPWTTNCNTDIPSWASEGPEGHPYRGLKTSLNFYGGMFGARAVIWHQGESDNHVGTSSQSYREGLTELINYSRKHFNPGLAWAISRVSHFPPSTNGSAILEAQENVKNSMTNTTWGAYYSDQYADANVFRLSDNVHFNQQGLIALGEQIAVGSYTPYSSPPSYQTISSLAPVEALPAPTMTVNHSSQGGYELIIPGNYKSYCWVEGDGDIKNCAGTGFSVIVNSGKWRCYVTHIDETPAPGHEKQNVSLTRSVELPLTNFSPSLGIGGSYLLNP